MGRQTLTREEIAFLTEGLGIDPLSITADVSSGEDRLAILQGRICRTGETPEARTDVQHQPQTPVCWQTTADAFADQLSTRFQVDAQVQVDRFDQSTVGQFLLGRSKKACLFRWDLSAASSPWWLSMDLSLVFPLLEHVLGGKVSPCGEVLREMTDVERRLVSRVLQPCQAAIAAAWPLFNEKSTLSIGNDSDSTISKEPVACGVFHVQLGLVQGQMVLAVPSKYARPEALGATLADSVSERSVDLSVVLVRATISNDELSSLGVGDIISTELRPDQPLQVELDGQVRFLARPGTQDGKKAIRID